MATDYRIDVRIDPTRVRSGRREVETELRGIENSARSLKDELALAFGGAALAGAVSVAVSKAKEFTQALGEISTQVDTSVFDMGELRDAAFEQARAFAKGPTEEARALYEIISAGATSSADALETLNSANELALGGITDTAVAADILTSVLNAYGSEAGSAREVSDTLFVGVRNGKTTVDELARSLGRVTPLAAQTGVSFDQLVASVAALTKGGIATSEAVTGVRAILSAVAKPADDAAKTADKLGISFNVAALEAKGLQGFLEDVVAKTGGSTEALAKLFSDTDALVPVLALAGQAGNDFAITLADLAQKAGATEAAVAKMRATPSFQADQLFGNITTDAVELATIFLDNLVPAMTFVNQNFDTIKAVVLSGAGAYAVYTASVLLLNSRLAIHAALVLSTAGQYGIMTAAQIAAGTATGALTAGVNGLTAAIARNPIGAFAVALSIVAGGLIFASASADDAADASNRLAEANKIAEAATRDVADAAAAAANATKAERIETIIAARAAVQKAQADVIAARAALDRAIAERELAGAIAAKRREEAGAALIGGGEAGGAAASSLQGEAGAIEARAASKVKAEADRLKAQADALKIRADGLKGLAALSNTPDPRDVSDLLGADDDARKKTSKKDDGPTFAEIEKDLRGETELLKLNGTARAVRATQLSAEQTLRRGLSSAEGDTVRSIVEENEALRRGEEFRKQIVESLDRELEVLSETGVSRDVRAAQLRAEEILERKLTEAEAKSIELKVRQNAATSDAADLYERIIGPLEDYQRTLAAVNALIEKGAISQAEANAALRDSPINRDLRQLELSLDGPTGRASEIEQARADGETKKLIVDRALEAEVVSVKRAADLRLEIERDTASKIRAIKAAQRSADLLNAQSVFDSLTQITKDFAGEQSGIYKAMFVTSKAFAIADSIVKIQQGIANALSLPFPANLGAVAAVAAQAASIVSNIKAVTLAFADGGFVNGPGGPRDDAILARLSAGEFVVNAAATSRNRPALEAINSGRDPVVARQPVAGGGGLSIKVDQINVSVDSRGDAQQDGEEVGRAVREAVLSITREEIDRQTQPGGPLSGARAGLLSS